MRPETFELVAITAWAIRYNTNNSLFGGRKRSGEGHCELGLELPKLLLLKHRANRVPLGKGNALEKMILLNDFEF